jgi:hypothetical protein
MRECVGDYSISTANGNVEGVDMLAGAGILIELAKYLHTVAPVNAPHCSVDNYWFWCRVSSVVPKRFLSTVNLQA